MPLGTKVRVAGAEPLCFHWIVPLQPEAVKVVLWPSDIELGTAVIVGGAGAILLVMVNNPILFGLVYTGPQEVATNRYVPEGTDAGIVTLYFLNNSTNWGNIFPLLLPHGKWTPT